MECRTFKIPGFISKDKVYLVLNSVTSNIPKGKSISLILDKQELIEKFGCSNDQLSTRIKTEFEIPKEFNLDSKSSKKVIRKMKRILGIKDKNIVDYAKKLGLSRFLSRSLVKKNIQNIFKDNVYFPFASHSLNSPLSYYSCILLTIIDKIIRDKYVIEIGSIGSIGPIGGIRGRKPKSININNNGKEMLLDKGQIKKIKKKPKPSARRDLSWDKVPIEKWSSNQLTQYIRKLYFERYGVYSFELDFPDDIKSFGGQKRLKAWSRIRSNLIEIFQAKNESMHLVKRYVDWIFKEKSKTLQGIVSINFIISPIVMNEWFVTRRRTNRNIEVGKVWR